MHTLSFSSDICTLFCIYFIQLFCHAGRVTLTFLLQSCSDLYRQRFPAIIWTVWCVSTLNHFPLFIVCHIWNPFSPELFNLFSCGDHVFHDLGSLRFDGLVNKDGSEFFCPNPIASLRCSINKCLSKIFGYPGGRVLIYHAGFQSQHCIKPGRVVWTGGRRVKSPRLSSAKWQVQGQSGLQETLCQK